MTASVLSRTLAITLLAASCCAQTENTVYEGVPFEMPRIQLPSIPQRSVCLTDFDAVGDGVTLNTEAFAKAIDQLARQGGGRQEVPASSPLPRQRPSPPSRPCWAGKPFFERDC